jgi:pentatricopeptide repeat protein
VITYSAAISACEKGSQGERVLELLSEMRAHGLVPDVITYNTVFDACQKSSQWAHALELLSEMRKYGVASNEQYASARDRIETLQRREKLNRPDVISYSAAISACEKGSQWQRALDLLKEMREQDVQPDLPCFNAAISACEKGSQYQRALELLDEIQEQGLEPDAISFSAAISACERAGERRKALRLYSLAYKQQLYSHWHRSECNAIDLHNFPSAVAKVAVVYALEEFREEAGDWPSLPDAPFIIITEQGLRSESSTAVEAILADQLYAALGAVEVTGNPGRLSISSEALMSWIEAVPDLDLGFANAAR